MDLHRSSRWPVFAALAIALISLGVAIGAWLRPIPTAGPPSAAPASAFTDQQTAEAKQRICDVFGMVNRSAIANSNRTNPIPGDEIGALATGLYAFLAFYDGGDYILDRLQEEPAAPVELTNSIKSFADTLKKLAMMDLAGEPVTVRDSVKRVAEQKAKMLDELCK